MKDPGIQTDPPPSPFTIKVCRFMKVKRKSWRLGISRFEVSLGKNLARPHS
jgi:hypothetical protein